MRQFKVDNLIVGGGLAGLALAEKLQSEDRKYMLIEARSRLGGRIETLTLSKQAQYDIGPTWYWPGQTRMEHLVQKHGLCTFEQQSKGEIVFEDPSGNIHHGMGMSSMAGSLRVKGGIGKIIEALDAGLNQSKIYTNSKLIALSNSTEGVRAIVCNSEGAEIEINAKQVVLAVPPRVVDRAIEFNPPLPKTIAQQMRSIPTWMASQAKFIAIYEKPFWRAGGKSGDALSRRGPLVEIHDASPEKNGPYALFGFVGTPPRVRVVNKEELLQLSTRQLSRLFGSDALSPLSIHLKDWAFDPLTSTPEDITLPGHPSQGMIDKNALVFWDGKVQLGSTETASGFGGYLEGALEASERVYDSLK